MARSKEHLGRGLDAIFGDYREKRLIIIGAGGHGKVVADIARQNGYLFIHFLDDDISKKKNGNYDVIGTTEDIDKYINSDKEYDFFVAVGNNEYRKKYINLLTEKKQVLPFLIHPRATVDYSSDIGEGSVVMANAVINADASIGKGCIINTAATVDHDCTIGDYVHISPGVHVAGQVTIGNNSWIGTGSNIINNVTIHQDVIIGAGTTVINSIKESGTYVGLPLRRVD